MLQLFPLNDKSGAVIAGLDVKSGRLRTTGAHGTFVYRIVRGGEIIKDDVEAEQLKRFKNVVYDVRIKLFIYIFIIYCVMLNYH